MAETTTVYLYGGRIPIIFHESTHKYQRGDTGEWIDMSPTQATNVLDKPGLPYWAAKQGANYLLTLFDKQGYINRRQIIMSIRQHIYRRDKAALEGKQAHAWIKGYIRHQLGDRRYPTQPELPKSVRVRNVIIAFLSFVKKNDIRFLASEEIVYSEKYGFAGQLDFLFTCGLTKHKLLHLGDWKSGEPAKVFVISKGKWIRKGSAPHDKDRFQTAGYQGARIEERKEKFGPRLIAYLGRETAVFKPFWCEEFVEDYAAFTALILVRRRQKKLGVINKKDNR
jgi:hypothetical protein